MKKILRHLLLKHLQTPKSFWILVGAITLVLGLGTLRVERRLDLMSLLPTDHPIVKASIQAGVGQHELLWVVAEGTPDDIGSRRDWADNIIENLLDISEMPLNGLSDEGGISPSIPVPENKDGKGLSLWPPLLAAGSLLEGDGAVARLVTEHLYAIAPILIGEGLIPLNDPKQLGERFKKTAKALASPDPIPAKLAQLDPLDLLNLLPENLAEANLLNGALSNIPIKIRTGYIETSDEQYVLVPLVLNFQNGETARTGRILAWIGNSCGGQPPEKANFKDVQTALSTNAKRPFPVKVTGAHAIAYWESNRLGTEVAISLCLSFILIGVVYWVGFRTLTGYGFVIIPLLLAMFWTLGTTGWILGRLNMMAAAFGAVLLGVGDDVGILIFSRYKDERSSGKCKSLSLRSALLSTGPGVIVGMLSTSLVFFSCLIAPFPGFRDLGLTAGIGMLACLATTFLLMPPMLLAFDNGKGVFAPKGLQKQLPLGKPTFRNAILAVSLVAFATVGIIWLRWEEDLRRFRQVGNPALELQENLGKVLGAGLQPLAIQLPMDDLLPMRWNIVADVLGAEGYTLPHWEPMQNWFSPAYSPSQWVDRAMELANREGLDPKVLKQPLSALSNSINNPLAGPLSLMTLLNPSQEGIEYVIPDKLSDKANSLNYENGSPSGKYVLDGEDYMFSIPIRLPETALDRVESALESANGRLVGTRPLFKVIKTIAKQSLREVVFVGFAAIVVVIGFFGRRWIFLGLAVAPMIASQVGVLGTLGWTNEPLTFLSLIAMPVALGVSVDTVFNLLNRARHDINAPAKVSRVNAVCAGTTLAGFGGLAFSSYKGLQGLGIAAIGGTAVALLTIQWLLPWILEKWPLNKN
ncbi:MAG: MMPL family transporter [Holophagaceae bacterium]|nr:MMPL family transporter [Holophagaceae bacterium]